MLCVVISLLSKILCASVGAPERLRVYRLMGTSGTMDRFAAELEGALHVKEQENIIAVVRRPCPLDRFVPRYFVSVQVCPAWVSELAEIADSEISRRASASVQHLILLSCACLQHCSARSSARRSSRLSTRTSCPCRRSTSLVSRYCISSWASAHCFSAWQNGVPSDILRACQMQASTPRLRYIKIPPAWLDARDELV